MLKHRRVALGMTQEALGHASGYSQNTIAQVESARYLCNLNTFLDICEALRIKITLTPCE